MLFVTKRAASSAGGATASMRSWATLTYSGSRSMPIQWRWSFLATAPVVPVPKNGSSTTSPGLELDRITL